DRKSSVIQDHGAGEEPDNQPLPAERKETESAKHHRRNQVPPIEPAEFRVARKIFDRFPISGVIHIANHPAHMRPPETILPRRVDVALLIGVLVVATMMCRPPQRPLLRRR